MGCGRRGTGNEGVKEVKVGRAHDSLGPPSLQPTPDYTHRRSPASPPARQPARHCPTAQNSFAARWFCSESTILHTYALHGTTLGSFNGNIYKQVARAQPSINTLGSYLPLGVTPLAVREDQRSRKREEMEGGGLYGLFSAQATESISRVRTETAYGHFNPSCHFAPGSEKTWSKCAKRF